MKLALVDDHAAYRQSLRIALSKLTEHQIIAEADGARAGCLVIQECKPDLALVDFLLGDGDGISLVRELRRLRVRTPVLLLGRSPHPSFLRDALTAGVQGFALKTEALERVIHAIGVVGGGGRYVSPKLEPYLHASRPEDSLALLSRREREVLCMLMEGKTSKEIARSLYISARTADAHRSHINRKLGVSSPSELARLLADQGMLG